MFVSEVDTDGQSACILIAYKSVCHDAVQAKVGMLTKFADSVSNAADGKAAARAVTPQKLAWLTACVMMDVRDSALVYCLGLRHVAGQADSAGCDVIASSGCIPVIVECLRRWPADEQVVEHAVLALYKLVDNGSASVHAVIKSVTGIKAALEAAKASRLDDDPAAFALTKLDL